MIKFQATATIHSISEVIPVTDSFSKRELILDDSWDKDGRHYTNFVLIEFSGDAMSQLDACYPGQYVTVEGTISGREYNQRIYNTIRGKSVRPYQTQQAQYSSPTAPMPGVAQSQQAYGRPQQRPPMPGYPQQPQQHNAPRPQYSNPQQYAPQQPQQYAPATAPMPAPAYAPAPMSGQAQSSRGNMGPGTDDLPF